jgi:predicted lipoprotein
MMPITLRRLAPALVLLAACLPAGAAATGSTAGRDVAAVFVGPALADFSKSAGSLKSAVDDLCAAPDDDALSDARAAFADALDDFGHVSVLRFGPLSAASRFERLFFWPDARAIGLKQVQGLIASTDRDAFAGGMDAKSAALQGFPALEYTLYGTGAEALAAGDAWRCQVAGALSANIALIARDLAADWAPGTAYATSFSAPADGLEPYRSDAEVNGEIVKALSTALQFVRSAELAPPLGEDPGKANGRRAAFWRSGLSASFIAAQVDGVRGLLAAAGYEQSLPEDSRYIASSIRFELDNAIRTLRKVEAPVEAAFASEPDRGRFAFALLALHHANELVNDGLSGALGLTMGFNALDGD